jgi:glycosyltransferase involved in cell wall biosynthesis
MSRIDVAVTCYNYGHFLRQCAESVLLQSQQDLRVLIIDDASTDATPAISAELTAEDPRVVICRHPVNIGHIQTYNKAIEWAQADYFLLLSADDYLFPGALERAVAVLDEHRNVDLVIGSYLLYRSEEDFQCVGADDGSVTILDAEKFIDSLAVQNWVSTATAVVRTTSQKRLGGYLSKLPHSGDLEMWLRFALSGQVAHVNQVQAVYRHHDKNMSLQYRGQSDFEQCKIAFLMHLGEIRARVSNGAMLVISIRQRLERRARRLILSAGRHGRLAELFSLSVFFCANKVIYQFMKLQHRLAVAAGMNIFLFRG